MGVVAVVVAWAVVSGSAWASGGPEATCEGEAWVRLDGSEVADLATAVAEADDGSVIDLCGPHVLPEVIDVERSVTLRGHLSERGVRANLWAEYSPAAFRIAAGTSLVVDGLDLRTTTTPVAFDGGADVRLELVGATVSGFSDAGVRLEERAEILADGSTIVGYRLGISTAEDALVSFTGGAEILRGVTGMRLGDRAVVLGARISFCLDQGLVVGKGSTVAGATLSDNGYETWAICGGGLFADAGSVVSASTIQRNYAPRGGGICAGGDLSMVATEVVDNHANEGGGLFTYGHVTAKDSLVWANYAEWGGGGVAMSGRAALTGLEIMGNRAPWGGGIVVHSAEEVTLSEVHVWNNVAAGFWGSARGGGIAADYEVGALRIESSRVSDNVLEGGGQGEGLYVSAWSTAVVVRSSSFDHGGAGGAVVDVVAEGVSITSECSDWHDDQVDFGGLVGTYGASDFTCSDGACVTSAPLCDVPPGEVE